MPGICFKITQGVGVGAGGSRAGTGRTTSGPQLEPADRYAGDRGASTRFHFSIIKKLNNGTIISVIQTANNKLIITTELQ